MWPLIPPLLEARATRLEYDHGPFMPDTPDGLALAPFAVTLCGDGRHPEDRGLVYCPDASGNTRNSTILRVQNTLSHLHDLVLSWPRKGGSWGHEPGTGDAIVLDLPERGGPVGQLTLERVSALYMGRNGLRILPAKGSVYSVVGCVLREFTTYGACGDEGIRIEGATTLNWDQVWSVRHRKDWGRDDAPWTGRGYTIRNCQSGTLNRLTAENVAGGILLEGCVGMTILTPHIETFAGEGPDPMPGLVLRDCSGCTVIGGIYSGSYRRGETSIRLEGSTTGCEIHTAYHAGVGCAVDDTNTRGNTIHRQGGDSDRSRTLRVSRRRNRVIE